jgi:hypothetical protein
MDGTRLEIILSPRGPAGVAFSGRGKVVEFSTDKVVFGGVAPDVLNVAEDWRLTVDFRVALATLKIPREEPDSIVVMILDGDVRLLLTGPDPTLSVGSL